MPSNIERMDDMICDNCKKKKKAPSSIYCVACMKLIREYNKSNGALHLISSGDKRLYKFDS